MLGSGSVSCVRATTAVPFGLMTRSCLDAGRVGTEGYGDSLVTGQVN